MLNSEIHPKKDLQNYTHLLPLCLSILVHGKKKKRKMVAESAVLVAIGTAMASGVVKAVLEKCVNALSKTSSAAGLKSAISGNLKLQLLDLERQLTKLDALLCCAESLDPVQHNRNDMLCLWLESVREAANFADNVLEDISYDQLRRRAESNMVSKLFSGPDGSLAFRIKIGRRLNKFMSMAEKIYKEAADIGLRPVELLANPTRYQPPAAMSTDLREIRENVDTSIVVGRQLDEAFIVTELSRAENVQVLGVIALVGMSGVGKTTLARKVYDNATVKDRYNKKTWIFVSEDFNLRRLLDEMLQFLTGENHNLRNIGAIEQKLQGCLQEERYLLVLDDVWNTDQQIWDSIRTSLLRVTNGCKSSVVLMTTQRYEVASVMRAYMTRTVNTLSKDDACELFEKKAFANKSQQQVSDLKDLGARILRKCGGLPLAINTLGSLMGSMNERRQWESVDKSEVWNLCEGQTKIMPWLLLSFNHLPNATIKQCFAHCSAVIPKGCTIGDERLIYYWIAQGFIQPSDTSHQSIMAIGRPYIQSMLTNGLLQSIDCNNNLSMHDLMHDLALYVSRDKCLIVREANDLHKSSVGVEHISIYGQTTWNSQHNFLKGNTQSHTLRTVVWFYAPISLDFLAQAIFLRTLRLIRCGLKEIPISVGRLKHLRILDLSDNPIEYLPGSIGRLYNLHFLGLSRCYCLVELPQQVTKLVALRIIATTEAVHIPKGMGQLKYLTRLPVVKLKVGDGCKIKELMSLQHLMGEVMITQLENIHRKEDAVEAGLKFKEGITSMKLVWTDEGDARYTDYWSDEEVLEGFQPHSNLKRLSVRNFRGKRFSHWLSNGLYCNNLTHLDLFNCKRCEKLPTLGCLPSLQSLIIDRMESVEVIGSDFYTCDKKAAVCSSSGHGSSHNDKSKSNLFPQLKKFELNNMPKLKDWFAPSDSRASSFPCLEGLYIVNCPSLLSAPSCFHSIRELTINGINSGQSLLMILNSAYNLTSLLVEDVPQLTVLSEPLLKCTSLRHIRIHGCNKLVGLPPTLQSLGYLQTLAIKYCDSLTSLPDIEGLLRLSSLRIENCKNVIQAPWGLASCVSIEYLMLRGSPKLHFLPDLGSLRRLRYLCLVSLSKEISVPRWLNHLSRLHLLSIGGFNRKLDHFDGIDQLPTCVRYLGVYGWRKIKSLPSELQSMTKLERLHLQGFEGVIALPEWLGNLSSLQFLDIHYCKNMKHLPSLETMQSLTRLRKLEIKECPLLEERCRTDGGEERLKVPNHTHIEFLV